MFADYFIRMFDKMIVLLDYIVFLSHTAMIYLQYNAEIVPDVFT